MADTDQRERRTIMRALRERAGLSIGILELRTGINRGRLSIIERGVDPTDAELERILDELINQIKLDHGMAVLGSVQR